MNIYQRIQEERDRQNKLWGDQSNKDIFHWMSILTEEVGEAAKDANDGKRKEMIEELIRVAAVAVEIIEYQEKPAKTPEMHCQDCEHFHPTEEGLCWKNHGPDGEVFAYWDACEDFEAEK